MDTDQIRVAREIASQVISLAESRLAQGADDPIALTLIGAAERLLDVIDQPTVQDLTVILSRLNAVWSDWGPPEYELYLLVSAWRDELRAHG